MEKVTVKIKLEREDVSTLMFLAGGKLSEEQWNKLKGTEYTVEDDDLEGQAIQLKLAISGIVVGNLLKKELSEGEVSSKSTYREKLIAMRKEMEERGLMVGNIRIRRRKDKYHVMEEQGDGRYFTIEGGECNSKEDAIKLKKRYLFVREKVRLFNQNLRIQLREKKKPNG